TVLVFGVMVYFAIDPTADRPPRGPLSGGGRNAEDVTVKGRELYRFLPGDVGGLTMEPAGKNGRDSILRIDRRADQIYDNPRSGQYIVLAEDLELAFESRPIEIIVEARNTGDFPATYFQLDYLARTEPGAQSGWLQSEPLTNEFKPYTFTYIPPKRGKSE